MFKRNLLIISVLALFLLPTIAYAINIPGWPLVPCGLSQDNPATTINEAKTCGQCDLFKLLKNLIDFVTYGLMPPLAVLLFVWAGFLILMGGANTNLVAQGRQIFTTTFYGIIILLSAWMITNTLILSIGSRYNNAGNWWEFTCTEPAPVSPPVVTPPKYSCNQNNQCVADPNGQYTTSDCDSKCQTPPGTFTVVSTSLPEGVINVSYSSQLSASGGTSPYAWSVSSGNLPPGITMSSAGFVSGTPTTASTSTFTVKVEDSSSPKQSATKQLSIVVTGTGTSALSITTSSLPSGTVGRSYSQSVVATGGTAPYTWSITQGTLPAGLTGNPSTGLVSGTPTTAGTSTFTVKVEDSSTPKQSATKQLSIVVAGQGGPTSCNQNFGLTPSSGCSGTNCVDASNLTPTHGCESHAGVCLLSQGAFNRARDFIAAFNNLVGGSCTLRLSSTIQGGGGPSISTCHKPANANSGTCADFNLLPDHNSCYLKFYQAAKDSGAVVSFLDEYVSVCRPSNATGGNIHVNL